MERSISRKGFLISAGLLGIGSVLPNMSAVNYNTESDANPDLVLNADEGEVYLIGDRKGRVTIKVDKQNTGIETMSLFTEDIKPGDGIPGLSSFYYEVDILSNFLTIIGKCWSQIFNQDQQALFGFA